MEILILLAGQQLGPFSEAQVRQYLGEGLVMPSDLATREGMEEWQSIDFVLANLPPSPTPEALPLESPAPVEQLPERETKPPLTMSNNVSGTLDPAFASPHVDTGAPPDASRKTKRKPGKIVIQPILPLEATVPVRKTARTGKTGLKLELLRPTTSLPSLTESVPMKQKPGAALIPPVQLALEEDFSGKTSAAPRTTPPAAPVAPEAPKSQPASLSKPALLKSPTATPAWRVWFRRMSRKVAYACAGLVLLLVFLIFSFIYLVSIPNETFSAAHLAKVQSAPPNPVEIPVKIQSPEAVPQTAADYSARGLARQSKGDLDGAILDYNQALDLDPKNVDAFYHRGLARQAKGDWAGAIADYTAVLGLDPKQVNAYSNRGFVKQAKGDPDGALADYNQALILNPKIPVAYYNKGLIEAQKGDLDEAIAAYNRALDLDPKMDIAFYNRGVVKNTEGNVDGAIADYTQALVLNPKLARAYCDRGFARQSKGDTDGALADYSRALALNPKMANAFFNRSLIKMQKGDLDGAIADSAQAIDLAPKIGQAYSNRGLARFGKGNLDGALADLRKFCELLPRDNGADSARLYIWLISREENPKGNADEELSTSLQNDWNSPPEELTSKIAAFLLGHIRENDLIANAASPDPSREPGQYCKVWYFAGMKRLLAGDTTAALNDFQTCVATQQNGLCEYIFARAELQALNQSHAIAAKPGASQ